MADLSLNKILPKGYNPTGAYSFEFKNRKTGKEITTINLMLAPEGYSIREGYLINTQKTISGYHIDDFGNDLKKININGSIYFFFAAVPPNGSIGKNGIQETAQKIGTDFATDFAVGVVPETLISGNLYLTGLQEFFRLQYIFSRFRDEDPYVPSGLLGISELKEALNSISPSFETIKVIYHDWDDNQHFEVVFNECEFKRTKDDPFSFTYNISLDALQREKEDAFVISDTGVKPSVDSVLQNCKNLFESAFSILDFGIDVYSDVLDGVTQIHETVSNILSDDNVLNQAITKRLDKIYLRNKIFEEALQTVETLQTNMQAVSENIGNLVRTDEAVQNQDTIADLNVAMSQITSACLDMTSLLIYSSNTVETSQIEEIDNENLEINDLEFYSNYEGDNQTNRKEVVIIYYVVKDTDDVFKISNYFYGDINSYSLILTENDLTIHDFDNGSLAGKMIRIPIEAANINTNMNFRNLVYTRKSVDADVKLRENELFGSDIALTGSKGLSVDGTGDLAVVDGIQTLRENLGDRIENSKGSLLWHQGWGKTDFIGIAGQSERLSVAIKIIEAQLQKDPRVSNAYVDRKTAKIKGDSVYYDVVIKPIQFNSFTLNNIKGI